MLLSRYRGKIYLEIVVHHPLPFPQSWVMVSEPSSFFSVSFCSCYSSVCTLSLLYFVCFSLSFVYSFNFPSFGLPALFLFSLFDMYPTF
jgi:hypothetical protein